MIENLNKQAFAPFGKVLRDDLPQRGFPVEDGWTQRVVLHNDESAFYFRANDELFLDFESGMTVLLLRKRAKVTAFYLDKPICLNAGTEFAVMPYREGGAVRMAYVSPPVKLESCPPIDSLKIADYVHLGEIYTLFYRECESGFLFKGEKHAAYELTYVDRGHLHCVVDGRGYHLKQGQLMIFDPEQWHMQFTDMDVTARFLTVSFDLDCAETLHFGDRIYDLAPAQATHLRQLLRETELSEPYSNDMIRANLKILLLTLLRDTGGRKKRLKTPTALRKEGTIVGKALQYIADHVYEKLSVEIVSKATGVSSSHLTALFHRQMNISPGDYIRRVKLEESKNLIREGRLNFSQIADALQYSTIHHYSRQFKTHFGVSPSEYAKSLKQE